MVENYSSGCPESQFLGAGPRNLSVPNYSNKTDEEHLCMVEGERELFCTLIKTLIPFPKTLPPNTIILGVIISIFKFEGAGQKHSDSSTLNISEGKLIY